MVACAGPLATISCEPRQTRKGAAATVDSGAGVWLVQVASIFSMTLIFGMISINQTKKIRHFSR